MLSISVDNLNTDLNSKELITIVQDAIENYVAGIASEVEYHLRGDGMVSVWLDGSSGLLEVSLDDTTSLHMHCSLANDLQKLRLALGIVDFLHGQLGGDYDECEYKLLRSLLQT